MKQTPQFTQLHVDVWTIGKIFLLLFSSKRGQAYQLLNKESETHKDSTEISFHYNILYMQMSYAV